MSKKVEICLNYGFFDCECCGFIDYINYSLNIKENDDLLLEKTGGSDNHFGSIDAYEYLREIYDFFEIKIVSIKNEVTSNGLCLLHKERDEVKLGFTDYLYDVYKDGVLIRSDIEINSYNEEREILSLFKDLGVFDFELNIIEDYNSEVIDENNDAY